MSSLTFLLVVVLIFIATILYLFASILVMEYVFYRAKEVQEEMIKSLTEDIDDDLDEAVKLGNSHNLN